MHNSWVLIPRLDRSINKFRDRSNYPGIDNPSLCEILAGYNLSFIQSSPIPSSHGRSRNLIVYTTGGKRILKEYVSSTSLSMIIHEHSILRHLAKTNFPAPRLIETVSGDTVVNFHNHYYAMFEFIEGGWHYHNFIWFPSQSQYFLRVSGEILAKLHQQIDGISTEGKNPNGFISRTEGWYRDMDWYLNKLSDCAHNAGLADGEKISNIKYLMTHVGYISRTLERLDQRLNQLDLPRQIIHADYGPYNLLFSADESITVLDFEIARLDWRLSEFVYALPRFVNRKLLGFSFKYAGYFMDGYRASIPLSKNEVKSLPEVWQFLKIRQAIACWNTYYETHSASQLAEAVNHLTWAGWASKYHQALVDRLHLS